jgi:hypothetical protein
LYTVYTAVGNVVDAVVVVGGGPKVGELTKIG